MDNGQLIKEDEGDDMAHAILGGGCFWCLESVFKTLKGVSQVVSGYSGGTDLSPTYDKVCTGTTGHAEVVNIEFNPAIISFQDLLDVFFSIHDATTPNRQGNDIGSQYRSIIIAQNSEQYHIAQQMINALKQQGIDIVTELTHAQVFYAAEAYHQHYFEKNPNNAYCQLSIYPKLNKLQQHFKSLLAH